jgi:hypothetical protein
MFTHLVLGKLSARGASRPSRQNISPGVIDERLDDEHG